MGTTHIFQYKRGDEVVIGAVFGPVLIISILSSALILMSQFPLVLGISHGPRTFFLHKLDVLTKPMKYQRKARKFRVPAALAVGDGSTHRRNSRPRQYYPSKFDRKSLDPNLVVKAEEYSSLQSLQYAKTSGFRPLPSHQAFELVA